MNGEFLRLAELFGPSLVLHVVRCTAFMAVLPMLGGNLASRLVRLLLGVAVGTAVFHLKGAPILDPAATDTGLELGLLTLREAAIGVAAGFAIHAMLALVGVAGELVSHEMGLSMAQVMDPTTGHRQSSVTALLEVLAFLTILELDLHHDALRVLLATYDHVGVGQPYDLGGVVEMLTATITAALAFGVRLVAPVVAILVLVTVVLIVLARAIPNINLLEFSFGLRILMSIAALALFLRFAMPFLRAVMQRELYGLTDLFAGT
jgi:flagellar biosynthetic protein FliR